MMEKTILVSKQEEISRKRLLVESLGLRNTFGLTYEQRVDLDVAYQQALDALRAVEREYHGMLKG